MGSVWVAHDRVLDIDVAVKLIDLCGAVDSAALARRLLEEARAAARLDHPCIVRVHDFGNTEHGDPYLAMELLEGEDLAGLLERRGRLDSVRACQLILPIVHALATAHERGIIHRDVKPENIFLAKDAAGTTPKLLDFGILCINRLSRTNRRLKCWCWGSGTRRRDLSSVFDDTITFSNESYHNNNYKN